MSGGSCVIVIGAHRSGTSVVARILDALGVFLGARLDPNHEALFFQQLDEWLLAQCGARWDNPEAVWSLIEDARQSDLVTRYLAQSIRSPRSARYLGVGSWLWGDRIGSRSLPWGFKDPRATFTLPLWLRLLPDAKVVHIHRHGVDVAQSLCARHQRHLSASENRYRRNRLLLGWFRKRAGFGDSPRLSTLSSAFELWESYVCEARRHVQALGPQALEIRYEDLAADPAAAVEQLARFVGVRSDAAGSARAAALITADRASAHRSDPALVEFAQRVNARVSVARDGTIPDRRSTEPAIRIVAT